MHVWLRVLRSATLLAGLLILVIVGAGFIWIVPIALLAVVPLAGGTLLGKLRRSSLVQESPSGVPSSQDASYTPQFDPSDRPT